MEHIIKQLVEMDAAGQELVRQAEESKTAEQMKMTEYKQKMYQDYLERQNARIEQFHQFQAQELEDQMRKIEKTHAAQLAQLREQYELHAQEWVDGMVRRCIGG